MECALANSFEFFVADDTFEGGATAERKLFDDFELIGEGDTLESGTALEHVRTDSLEVLVEDDALEGGAIGKTKSSMTSSLSGRVILLSAEHLANADILKFVMLLCSPNTTLSRWSQLASASSEMLSSLANPERSTRRRERHTLNGWNSPHPIEARLGHLKQSSIEPWERLLSSSLSFSALERS